MNIPLEIIKLTIEGGWKPLASVVIHDTDAFEQSDFQTLVFYKGSDPETCAIAGRINIYRALCDPTFWSSLGKALGLEKRTIEVVLDGDIIHDYKQLAHRLFDLILTQQDTTVFWQELLDQSKKV